MEPKFQNTFIPKRPVVTSQRSVASSQRKKVSFFSLLITLVFIAGLVAAGGVFAFTKYLESDISKKDQQLQQEIAALEPQLIDDLATADAQMNLASNMLSAHLVPSRFFEHLESITLQNIRFTSFTYNAVPGSNPNIALSGTAPNYEAVALQSDVFARDQHVRNSLFSGLGTSETGSILFEVSAQISNRLTSYKN